MREAIFEVTDATGRRYSVPVTSLEVARLSTSRAFQVIRSAESFPFDGIWTDRRKAAALLREFLGQEGWEMNAREIDNRFPGAEMNRAARLLVDAIAAALRAPQMRAKRTTDLARGAA